MTFCSQIDRMPEKGVCNCKLLSVIVFVFKWGAILTSRFDEMAASWDEDPQKVERACAVARQIRCHVALDPEMKALEFGCGTGLLSFALKDDLGHITLVDNSPGMLDVLERKIAAGAVKNMTPLLLDLTSGGKGVREKFDIVFTMMALHHIPQPASVLSVLFSLLNDGGYLAVAELEKGDTMFHGAGFGEHDGFSRKELSIMAQNAGFGLVCFCDCFTIRRKIEGVVENFNVFLMLCRKNGG